MGGIPGLTRGLIPSLTPSRFGLSIATEEVVSTKCSRLSGA
jgi:hypothetical protein